MLLPSYAAGDALSYVSSKGWRSKRSGDEIVLEVCPLCGGKNWRTYINDVTGLWSCKHGSCAQAGNHYQLLKALGDLPVAVTPEAKAPKHRPSSDLIEFEVALEVDEDAKAYLVSRGLTMATAKAWHLGVKTDDKGVRWLMLPYIVDNVVRDIKYRSLPPMEKRFHRLKGGDSILYGGNLLAQAKAEGRDQLYICEGEIDQLTLWQHGFWPAVSTTTGAGSFKSDWYDAIVAFDPKTIIVCYDSDAAGQKGAEALLKKFENRDCLNLVLPTKDANAFFMEHTDEEFAALIAGVKPAEVENAKSMATVLDMLQEQLWFSANAFDGMPSQFADVNAMIAGGYWNGQLVTMSGPSGTGKTSFVLQELLQMAKNGSPTYLLCLEMPEIMMLRKIMEKEFGVPMLQITEEHVKKYRPLLQNIPFYMGSKSGSLDVIEETIRAAVRRYDLKLVAFDNINYFVRSIEHVTQEIARVTKRMKELAVDLGVPIIQIAQPRKFDDNQRMMTGADLKDSAAIEQDSDTIILLHRARIQTAAKDVGKATGFQGNKSPYTLLRVDKARYSSGGEMMLYFDGARSTYRELSLGEREAMVS